MLQQESLEELTLKTHLILYIIHLNVCSVRIKHVPIHDQSCNPWPSTRWIVFVSHYSCFSVTGVSPFHLNETSRHTTRCSYLKEEQCFGDESCGRERCLPQIRHDGDQAVSVLFFTVNRRVIINQPCTDIGMKIFESRPHPLPSLSFFTLSLSGCIPILLSAI